MTTLEVIRLVAPEFSGITDSVVSSWISLAEPLVNNKLFGDVYPQALAYYTCHMMKMSGVGDDAIGDISSMALSAARAGISSLSEGGSSIALMGGQQLVTSAEVVLSKTIYGQQYLALAKVFVVPILI